MEKGFKTGVWCDLLSGSYPIEALSAFSASKITDEDYKKFVRLWITEGIPFAFKNRPIIYEEMREWLADRLDVFPKNISMTGSGRVGYSLAPSKWLREFSFDSDIDLFVVSKNLFDKASEDFHSWADQFGSGLISPHSEYQKQLWDENLRVVTRTTTRGFLDGNKVPYLPNYPTIFKCALLGGQLTKRLYQTPSAPKCKRASFRFYSDWPSALRQITFNIKRAVAEVAALRQASQDAPSPLTPPPSPA